MEGYGNYGLITLLSFIIIPTSFAFIFMFFGFLYNNIRINPKTQRLHINGREYLYGGGLGCLPMVILPIVFLFCEDKKLALGINMIIFLVIIPCILSLVELIVSLINLKKYTPINKLFSESLKLIVISFLIIVFLTIASYFSVILILGGAI